METSVEKRLKQGIQETAARFEMDVSLDFQNCSCKVYIKRQNVIEFSVFMFETTLDIWTKEEPLSSRSISDMEQSMCMMKCTVEIARLLKVNSTAYFYERSKLTWMSIT